MTKKQLFSMVAVSTLVLSNASAVFADDVSSSATLGDSSALVSPSDVGATVGQPTDGAGGEVSYSTTPVKPVENQGSASDTSLGKESKPSKDATVTDGAGVEVSNSTTPVKQVHKDDSTSTSLGKDSKPSKDATVTDGAGVEVSDSTSTVKSVEKKESSSDKLKLDENKSENTGTVENIGTNAGQVSESTKQVIQDVSYNAPVVLESGYQVVHTQDAVVTAVDTAGNTVTTTAENLGGKTNTDGTVSFKTSTGEMKTLPHTGEKTAWWSWIVGILILMGAVYLGAKEKISEWFDKIRGIEYEYVEEDEDDDE